MEPSRTLTLDPFLAPPDAFATHSATPPATVVDRQSCTYKVTTIAFLALAALDAFHPSTLVTGSWWLVLLLAWIAPWPNRTFDTTRPLRLDQDTLLALATLLVFSWLYARAWGSFSETLTGWWFTDRDGPLRLLNFPLQTALAGIAVAALLARPLYRAFGTAAASAAFILTASTIGRVCIETLSDLTRWSDRPVSNALHTFDAVFPLLLLMHGCAWLDRRQPRLSAPRRTLLARLGPAFDRVPRWFARSAIAPLLVLTAGATTLRALVDAMTDLHPALSALVTLALPVCTLLVTTAVIHDLRRVRTVAHAASRFERLRFGLRATLSAALLAPLWLWTLLMDAPLAEHYALDSLTALRGPAWALHYDSTTRTLRLSGEYQYGIATAFAAELSKHADVRTIELEGPGGRASEGFAIAEAIEIRDLPTHVSGECESACTIAFMAGRERTMVADAALGFHSSRSPVALFDDDDADFNAHLERRGVAADFIRRADEVPSADMWYPTNATLLEAGVITSIR